MNLITSFLYKIIMNNNFLSYLNVARVANSGSTKEESTKDSCSTKEESTKDSCSTKEESTKDSCSTKDSSGTRDSSGKDTGTSSSGSIKEESTKDSCSTKDSSGKKMFLAYKAYKGEIYMTLIGAKISMALSGLLLLMFIIAHLFGNMQIFLNKETFNAYPEALRHFPILLWSARILLLVTLVIHISIAVYLEKKNKATRKIQYNQKLIPVGSSVASRTMMYSGLTILTFVLFHLAHLTWRCIYIENSDLDLYSLMIVSFKNPFISIFYILAQISLATHLSHGFSSAAQTLSLTRKFGENIRRFGQWFAVIVSFFYISIPVSIWLGVIHD